jgi:DNA ligase 1
MKRFAELFAALDGATSTLSKVQSMIDYFGGAPAEDAAWALYFLSGQKIKRAVNTRLLREWVCALTELPLWLVEESYETVGDLAEALALLGKDGESPSNDFSMRLHELVETRIVPLPTLASEEQRALIQTTYRELPRRERFVWLKLITGSFRVGVARTLVNRALAQVATVPAEVMAHRLMGNWAPTAADYLDIMRSDVSARHLERPYPFFLAHPLVTSPAELGPVEDWQAEWKWDGIRAQLIHREGAVLVWSRGEELVTDRFPEVAEVGRALPQGVVLDGEILAWREESPLPFSVLQKRIGRKTAGSKALRDAPVAFMAFDLLEEQSEDLRGRPLHERRARLEALVATVHRDFALRISPCLHAEDWREVTAHRASARGSSVEGLMIKRRDSAYGVGRPRGDWWKWKVDPYSIDAVLIYAQKGHGRRADLFTDYTFGVWDKEKLVPIAKAYSGLTDAEIREVNAFVRSNTLESFGPVRVVRPELVFELHFEGIQPSPRHKSGVAVRFPRMHRWRKDKFPADADTLDALRSLANFDAKAAP